MSCFSVTKVGFLTLPALVDDIISELTGNVSNPSPKTRNVSTQYFEVVHDAVLSKPQVDNRIIILKSTPAVDPLANAEVVGTGTVSNSEPGWRLCFNIEADNKKMHVHVGTDLQYTDNGDIAFLTNREMPTYLTLTGASATAAAPASGNVIVTLTFASPRNEAPFAVGSKIIVSGATQTDYNGTFTINTCTTTTVTYLVPRSTALAAGGNNVTIQATQPSLTPGLKEPSGNLGDIWTGGSTLEPAPDPTKFNEFWINRDPTVTGYEAAYPMSYLLTLTNRGIFLAVWEGSQEENPQALPGPFAVSNPNPESNAGYGYSPLRWFLVQRPVDRLTGHVRGSGELRGSNDARDEKGRCPVIAIVGYGAPVQYRKLVVRESDVPVPSRKRVADAQTEDQPAMLNPYQQQSLTETGEFVVTFVNSINTSRFRYPDELDMLGTVSARVIGPGTSVVVRVYDETDDGTPTGTPMYRRYTALYSTERYGVGMRLMVLTGVGIDINDPTDSSPAALARADAVEDYHVYHTGA